MEVTKTSNKDLGGCLYFHLANWETKPTKKARDKRAEIITSNNIMNKV